MKQVAIPGGTMMLREKQDLSVRMKRRVQGELADAMPVLSKLPYDENGNFDEVKAMADGVLTKEAIDAFYMMVEVAFITRITEWTLDITVPKTIEEVEDLPEVLYAELALLVLDGWQEIIADVDFQPSDPRAEGFNETPTVPLGD